MDQKFVALYIRTSTHDQQNSLETQRKDLEHYAQQRGWTVYECYVDTISGAKDRRPAMDRLLEDARRARFQGILVTKLDRWARSVRHLLNTLQELTELGIHFTSTVDMVDLSSAYGRAMVTIIGAMAELERDLIRARVVRGIQAAVERGIHVGRPAAPAFDLDKAKHLLASGKTKTAVAAVLKISRMTLMRRLGTAVQNPVAKRESGSVDKTFGK